MQQDYRHILRYGFGLSAIIAGLLFLFFISYPYHYFAKLFKEFRSEEELVMNFHEYGFTLTTYWSTILCIFSLMIICFYLFRRLKVPGNNLSVYQALSISPLTLPFRKIFRHWVLLPGFEKIILAFFLIILAAIKVYLLQLSPLMIDETATYVLFINKGLAATVSYYPIPNNHILFTILCLPFKWIGSNPFYILKLPNVLVSLILFPCMYVGLRTVLKMPGALTVAVGCNFSYYVLIYSIQGRGYLLLLLWTFVASFSILKIVLKGGNEYWFWFILASISGFYTIPVFLYPFSCMVVFGLFCFLRSGSLKAIFSLVIAGGFVVFGTVLLYSPVILVSGADQLYGNEYVVRLPWQVLIQRLSFYLKYTQGAMMGQESIGAFLWLLGVLFLVVMLVFKNRFRTVFNLAELSPVMVLWALCGAVIFFPLILIQGVLPPERVWVFKIFADFLIFGLIIQILISYFSYKRYVVANWLVIGLLFIFSGYQVSKLSRDIPIDFASERSFERVTDIIEELDNHNILLMDANFRFHLLLYSLTHNAHFVSDESVPKPGSNYSIIILKKDQSLPEGIDFARYDIKYQDAIFLVYLSKN